MNSNKREISPDKRILRSRFPEKTPMDFREKISGEAK
jgi:hypothetical protein